MNNSIFSYDKPQFAELLDTRAAAQCLGVSKSFLDKKRVLGGGPVFCKVGRRVFYARSDLEQWIGARRFSSTSEVPA